MKLLSRLTGILLILSGLALADEQSVTITQKQSGRSIEVVPLQVEEGRITFRANEKEFTVQLDQLTEDSVRLLEQWKEAQAESQKELFSALNKAISHELFGNKKSLWSETAKEVAERLEWPKESETSESSSYRFYPPASYGFANAHPYSCVLYGGMDEKVEQLSLVFANKGDYGSTAGRGEDHFKSQGELPSAKDLNSSIQRDAEAISLVLTEAMGEPVRQRYGEKTDRRTALRWDKEGHSFILSEEKGEYVHLLIVPTELAEEGGKQEYVKDSDLRKILMENVIREKNGDVRINNIPMVDQGPKGYCAPATFERAMRYMAVPADMYLLATLATAPGGGTYTGKLAEDAKRIIRSKARRIREMDLSKRLDIRTVARYVDKGIPLMWQMASLDVYNEFANKVTEEREGIDNFSQWKQELASKTEAVLPQLSADSNHHICMIIGYNADTEELAVSDSWGPRYELRWIPLEVAKAITTSGGFVIDL